MLPPVSIHKVALLWPHHPKIQCEREIWSCWWWWNFKWFLCKLALVENNINFLSWLTCIFLSCGIQGHRAGRRNFRWNRLWKTFHLCRKTRLYCTYHLKINCYFKLMINLCQRARNVPFKHFVIVAVKPIITQPLRIFESSNLQTKPTFIAVFLICIISYWSLGFGHFC